LNDSEEYVNAREFIKQWLDNRVASDKKLRSIVSAYAGQLFHGITPCHAYIASFSMDGDSLSQWRGYCPNRQGVAIGFHPKALSSDELDLTAGGDKSVGTSLLKCVYTQKEKAKLLEDRLNHFLKSVTEHSGADSMDPGLFLGALTEVCSFFFKNESFFEEREWRLLVRCMNRDVPQRKFHMGRSTLVPHLQINLRKNASFDFIKEIVIGPTSNPSLAVMGVKALLDSRELRKVEVRNQTSRIVCGDTRELTEKEV